MARGASSLHFQLGGKPSKGKLNGVIYVDGDGKEYSNGD
jgi:hypothetical protein